MGSCKNRHCEDRQQKGIKMTKQEIRDFLIKHCLDDNGVLDLSNLDFTGCGIRKVDISAWKVDGNMNQSFQKVNGGLIQDFCKADTISQCGQTARRYIFQHESQAGEVILQYGHKAKIIENKQPKEYKQ